MHTRFRYGPALAVLTAFAIPRPALAQVLITNGSFESGLTGWTRADQVGSQGTFVIQTGTTSPVNGAVVPAPPAGTQAAMTDALGPGSHVLFQDFVVPTYPLVSAQLQFSTFIGNRANAYFIPGTPTLDFSTPALNQQVRVDILRGATDPFSVSASDVLFTVFQSQTTDPLVSGYTVRSANLLSVLSSNPGATLRLRFSEVDNVAPFQLGVDNVSLTLTPVPEPSGLVLVALACVPVLRRIRRRQRIV